MLTILNALLYSLGAVLIIGFILANRTEVTLELVLLSPINIPLYVPVVLAFSLGLLIGLLYAARGALAHRVALRRAKRMAALPKS